MASLANAKVKPDWDAHYAVGDVRATEFGDGTFDAVVVSKLFQHVEDWQQGCRELIRVTKPGGCIVQINERGAFGNAVRRAFAARADELGCTGRYPGLDPHSDAVPSGFMVAQSCVHIALDMPTLGWSTAITYGEALRRLKDRLFAEFWYLLAGVHDRLIAETSHWVDLQPGGAATVQLLKPFLVVQAFRTPATVTSE
jgi:SAM-dependent methyltransferase